MAVNTSHNAKKPYLKKKDLIGLGIVVAIILLIILLYFTVFQYMDGSLRTGLFNETVDTHGENWLIVNVNRNDSKYFKIGVVNEADGYEFSIKDRSTNIKQYYYTPKDETSLLENVYISGSAEAAAALSNDAHDSLIGNLGDGVIEDSGIVKTIYNDVYFYYYYVRYSYSPADNEETEEDESAQVLYSTTMNAYCPTDRGYSFILHAKSDSDSADVYMTEEDMLESINDIIKVCQIDQTLEKVCRYPEKYIGATSKDN